MVIKKIFLQLKKYIYNRIFNRKVFLKAKIFLDKGIYYIPYNKKEIRKIDKFFFSIKNMFLFQIYLNKKSGGGIESFDKGKYKPITNINFNNGLVKIVLLTGDMAYAFFLSEKIYFETKSRFEQSYHKFNYPCIEKIYYNDSYKCIVMDRVIGELHKDDLHRKILLKELLRLETMADTRIDKNGMVQFLQHGDVKPSNVLWDDEKFVFIDYDSINYFPPLFDFLHFCASVNYELSEILTLLYESKETLEVICKISKIDINDNYLDEIFYRYLLFHVVHKISFYTNFRFLTLENTIAFPKTNEYLRSIIIK